MKQVMKKRGVRKVTAAIQRGVTLDVRGDELVARIARRIQWHRETAQEIDAELKKVAALPPPAAGTVEQLRRASAEKDLQARLREHEERSAFLAFVRDHLSRRSLYQLNGSDLHMMEIMPSSVHW